VQFFGVCLAKIPIRRRINQIDCVPIWIIPVQTDRMLVDPEKVIFRHIEVEDCGLLGLTG
jgi:hypothetical protein